MTPDEMVSAAIEVAEEGLAAGELPIGAVVVMGNDIVGRAYTQDNVRKRRLVHAELQAMIEADELLGWNRRPHLLRLAVNLEPCLMCLGAAMAMSVTEVYFGLESPGDGAAGIAASWKPASSDMPWYTAPTVVGGVRREQCRDQFRRYCEEAADSGFRALGPNACRSACIRTARPTRSRRWCCTCATTTRTTTPATDRACSSRCGPRRPGGAG